MIQITKFAARAAGEIANIVLACIFITVTLVLYGKMNSFIASGGGFAAPSDLGAAWIARQIEDPMVLSRVVDWAAAWGCGVAMVGCGWMSILGLRWTYHAFMRLMEA